MSERKVLNKYYPPDFDPSKIPKVKGNRNATFIIRVMAPCNMRCTTCGEYIYKGRKFNARKEDVDDMDYLGLRIYRFYIKCTACVSEICFRTDPESCDYVLEAGATRNFEALKRAEEQLEREEIAYREELENNPMKLLEERTAASKLEMDVAESLDELRELNRKKTEINIDDMMDQMNSGQIAKRVEEEDEIAKDEAFIAAAFRRDAVGGERVKRILDSDSNSDGETESKVQKVSNPTDHLTGIRVDKRKEVWEKSVGGLSTVKKELNSLLVKKPGLVDADYGSEKQATNKTSEVRGDDTPAGPSTKLVGNGDERKGAGDASQERKSKEQAAADSREERASKLDRLIEVDPLIDTEHRFINPDYEKERNEVEDRIQEGVAIAMATGGERFIKESVTEAREVGEAANLKTKGDTLKAPVRGMYMMAGLDDSELTDSSDASE